MKDHETTKSSEATEGEPSVNGNQEEVDPTYQSPTSEPVKREVASFPADGFEEVILCSVVGSIATTISTSFAGVFLL